MKTGCATLLLRGNPKKLGAHWSEQGIHFSLVAPQAQKVFLCLYDEQGENEIAQLPMHASHEGVWHGFLENAAVGLIYNYRVEGEYAPHKGLRFNGDLRLLDPYARHVVGESHQSMAGRAEESVLKGQIVHETYDWSGDESPNIGISETVIYETHIKGLTKLNPYVDEVLRGTYAALAHPAVLSHFKGLGVTTVEFMPVQLFLDEVHLTRMGLRNYWGYNPISYFAISPRYWSGRAGTTPMSEFRDAVKALHGVGIEVILDVVFNHTAESDAFGQTMSFRGIDNALYYHLTPDDLSEYENWSGCGNCLNLRSAHVQTLVMDALRYWVEQMRVDGFRLDLAPILGRDAHAFSSTAPIFTAIANDAVLSQVKWIAEPWDIGKNGYQLGHFPNHWLEWNDQYRDVMREFWLHQNVSLGVFAQRFSGSSDIFERAGRHGGSSVNYLSAHDGFTLHDLVTYSHKHNHANGESNQDGRSYNASWNVGVEGETTDKEVNALRGKLKRAMLATLFFSQGTPMLHAGDELGRTQRGNNNAYCQDNDVSWLSWAGADEALMAYVQRLIRLRKRYAVLRRVAWASGAHEIDWRLPSGAALTVADWEKSESGGISILLRHRLEDTPCLILVNPTREAIHFSLPQGRWQEKLDSDMAVRVMMVVEGEMHLSAHSIWLAAQA